MIKTKKNIRKNSMKFSKKNKISKKKKMILDKNKYCLDINKLPVIRGLNAFYIFNKNLTNKENKELYNFMDTKWKKELKLEYGPNEIKPQDDFYDSINSKLIKIMKYSKELDYLSKVDDVREIQDKVFKELYYIFENYINENKDRKKCEKMSNFFNSIKSLDKKDNMMAKAKEFIEKLDDLRKDKNNIWELLAMLNKYEYTKNRLPFYIDIQPNIEDPTIASCFINVHKFVWFNLDIYNDVDKYKYNIKQFNTYITNLFDNLLGKNHGLNTESVFEVERELYELTTFKNNDIDDKLFYKINKEDAFNKYNFNWDKLSKHFGFKITPDFFITNNLNYLKNVMPHLIENWNSDEWKPYWVWIYTRYLCRITHGLNHVTLDFYGKFQKGAKSILTEEIRIAMVMCVAFNKFINIKYLESQKEKQVELKYIDTLSKNLKFIFKQILQLNKWLSSTTKLKAIDKIENINFNIGNTNYIETLIDDPEIEYNDSLYDNLSKLYEWRHNKMINSVGKKVINIINLEWSTYPFIIKSNESYIVNASYIYNKNSIYINSAFIQKPFINIEYRDLQYNLSRIGFTIAHELTHSLDNFGSYFDKNGKFINWWTNKDRKIYEKKQNEIIKQYEAWTKRDGIEYNSILSIGEDIADIGGLQICSEYLYRYFQIDKDHSVIPLQIPYIQQFYINYALQSKQFIKKKSLYSELETNPHPPNKYRCNVPLSRLKTFIAIYDIKKGDGMWWSNPEFIF